MPKSDDYKLPSSWEKARVISSLIASVLIPVVIAIIGHAYTGALKQNEIGVRYVELAVGILAEQPKPDSQHLAVRKWAIEIINFYSAVPLSGSAIEELQENQILKQKWRQMEELFLNLERMEREGPMKPIEKLK